MPKLRIIFLGTPGFAVPSLEALIDNGFDVAAVVTAPDKPAGRGLQLQESPVKQFAVSRGLPVLQPVKLKDPEFLEELRSYKANLGIVIAFRMLPVAVWDMPELGTFNLHASALPQYRGAAPINWAVINGERETGLTTFFLKHEIDTGDILYQERILIEEDETAGQLHDRMANEGAKLVVKTAKAIEKDAIEALPQPRITDHLKPAPKIFKEDCRIQWNKSSHDIHNLIRGLSPFPGAFTMLDGKVLKIYSTAIDIDAPSKEPGTVETDNKTLLRIYTLDNALLVRELQLEGKKKMGIEEFLRGYRVQAEAIG